MRRSTRSADVAVSCQIPESLGPASSCPPAGFIEDPTLPKFRFIQSSPHSGVSNVNGEVETVHWVVKDRPFAIRILELPVFRNQDTPTLSSEEVNDDQDMAWNEIQVRAEVVYTKTRKPVKMPSASEKSALSVQQSVIPSSVYNHRRSANMLGQHQQAYSSSSVEPFGSTYSSNQQGSLLLKGGSGIELSVRLAVLSSHIRNDFCVHLQLVLRGQVIAEWYSETIKSVSKWDKVRQLQDSTTPTPKSHHYNRSNPTHSNRSIRAAPRASAPIASTAVATSHSIRTTLRSQQASQKPVSASIKPSLSDDSSAALAHGDEELDSSPHVDTSSTTLMDCDIPSNPIQASQPQRLSRTKSSPPRAVSSSLHDFTMLDDDHSVNSTGGGKHGKKKKASGEEVFEMLERIQRIQQEMSQLIQQHNQTALNKKKRAATWEPSVESAKPSKSEYPSEQEAADGARLKLEQSKSQNKKPKRAELTSQTQVHSLPATPRTYQSGDLASNINSFLDLVDQSVLAHVRSALTGFLLTRPDLGAILQRLMMTMNEVATQAGQLSEAPHSASWSQQDQIPMLNQSGYMWSDERYELGQPDGDRAMVEMEEDRAFVEHVAAPVVVMDSRAHQQQSGCYDNTPVMSPFGLDEGDDDDDSTTMGSPSYTAATWSDADWSTTEPSSPFQHDSSQNPSLTDSSNVFAAFMERPVSF